jgi:hypothetical protein
MTRTAALAGQQQARPGMSAGDAAGVAAPGSRWTVTVFFLAEGCRCLAFMASASPARRLARKRRSSLHPVPKVLHLRPWPALSVRRLASDSDQEEDPGGTYTALVVVLFAVVKFTEGAWLIVIIFPVLVYTLIRRNRQYRKEAAILEDLGDDLQPHTPNYSRRVVLLLVDSYDLATIAAIRYAKSLHPSTLRAVHFSLDSAQAAKLRRRWLAVGLTIPLELADCVLRPHAHPRPGARPPGPVARHGRRRERWPPRDDQPRVRPARVAAATSLADVTVGR